MDTTTVGEPVEMNTTRGDPWHTPSIEYSAIGEKSVLIEPSQITRCQKRLCYGNPSQGEFPLAASPYIVLHVLTESNLDPQDLASLEASCRFFRQSANFSPDFDLSISELAALDMCQRTAIFKPMTQSEREHLKERCGGSWKLVLRFLRAGETCFRREKCQAIAGPGHSVVVTKSGAVYTFGSNSSGQLGHGTTEEEWRPRLIRSLHGIRIIQASAGAGRTMLISDTGRVYAFGKDSFGDAEYGIEDSRSDTSPRLVESLDGIFADQGAIGNFFTAILSGDGRVYTFSWGADAAIGHQTEPQDQRPYLLKGDLENVPVVQIAAGYCYLLALTCQPSGMSSVGCGLGGKLGHGSRTDEKYPRKIEHFQQLKLRPVIVAAGVGHTVVLGKDGRVCTWGWGRYGCLGHGNEDCEFVPKVVEALQGVKAVHVTTGDYTTFVVADNGDVYSFGCGESSSLGHLGTATEGQAFVAYLYSLLILLVFHGSSNKLGIQFILCILVVIFSSLQVHRHANLLKPELVVPLKQRGERVVQISLTNSIFWNAHTFSLTEAGKLYAFGAGDKAQLGTELLAYQSERGNPELVDINLD